MKIDRYFKRNNLKFAWRVYYNSWVSTLCKCEFAEFLKKNFKNAERLYYKYLKLRFCFTRKPVIPLLEYMTTTMCTMNCKHCNTFIPHFSNETHVKPTSFEQFRKDIDTLLKGVDFIEVFGFVGGEPLIVKELAKMIEYACSKSQIHHVFVATNCTIMPDENLIKAFKNKKVYIQISDYRHVKNIKGNLKSLYDEYKKMGVEHKINITHPQEGRAEIGWLSMPELYKDSQDKNVLETRFNDCYGQYSNMLVDGKLVQDTLCAYMHRNLDLTKEAENEIVDIRKAQSAKNLAKEIIKFYAKPYSAFCHYCHFDNIQYNLPCGEQLIN